MKLSDKLQKNGMWFVAIPVLLLITLFLPIVNFEYDGSKVLGTSIFQMMTNNLDSLMESTKAPTHLGYFFSAPLFLIIGLILSMCSGVYFMVANKSGYEKVKPLMIIGVIGAVFTALFIMFLLKTALATGFFNVVYDGVEVTDSVKTEFIKETAKELKLAWGVWVMALVSLTGAGLSLAAHLDNKK